MQHCRRNYSCVSFVELQNYVQVVIFMMCFAWSFIQILARTPTVQTDGFCSFPHCFQTIHNVGVYVYDIR